MKPSHILTLQITRFYPSVSLSFSLPLPSSLPPLSLPPPPPLSLSPFPFFLISRQSSAICESAVTDILGISWEAKNVFSSLVGRPNHRFEHGQVGRSQSAENRSSTKLAAPQVVRRTSSLRRSTTEREAQPMVKERRLSSVDGNGSTNASNTQPATLPPESMPTSGHMRDNSVLGSDSSLGPTIEIQYEACDLPLKARPRPMSPERAQLAMNGGSSTVLPGSHFSGRIEGEYEAYVPHSKVGQKPMLPEREPLEVEGGSSTVLSGTHLPVSIATCVFLFVHVSGCHGVRMFMCACMCRCMCEHARACARVFVKMEKKCKAISKKRRGESIYLKL